MAREFFPRRDSEALNFTRNFSRKLSADPVVYGTTPERAAEYAVLQQRYESFYMQANSPATRGLAAVARKNAALAQLRSATRQIAHVIRGMSTVTAAMRVDLNLS